MTTTPTDPTTAVETIRRAADAMRDVAGAVGTVGHDWTVYPPDGHYSWTIGDINGTRAVRVAETPDYGGLELPDHIASWPPPIALLVAALLEGIATDIEGTLADHGGGWFGRVPAEWTAAYNLAVAFLERRPT
jgi:hypothetical protein